MSIYISRHNPVNHQILRTQIIRHAYKIMQLKFFTVVIVNDGLKTSICDDPIALIYWACVRWERPILWAFELWSEQRKVINITLFVRHWIFRVSEMLAYRIAKKIIFPSKLRREYISKKYNSNIINKSEVKYNVPESMSEVIPENEKLREILISFRNKYNKLLVYSGALQPGRELEAILKIKNSAHFGIVVCGTGELGLKFEHRSKQIENILYLGQLDRKDLKLVYQHVDIGILFYSNDMANTRYCAPIKMWEYLEHNLELYANTNHALLTEWKPYITFHFSNIDELIQTIDKTA